MKWPHVRSFDSTPGVILPPTLSHMFHPGLPKFDFKHLQALVHARTQGGQDVNSDRVANVCDY